MDMTTAAAHTLPKKGCTYKSGPTLLALGLGFFVDRGEEQAMSVLSPVLQTVFGLSFTQLGLMTTLRNITQTVSAPFWGYAADRWSRKKVLIFGTGVWGLWTLVVGLMPTFNAILVIRIISGLGLGCLMPASFSLISDHFASQKRGQALGIVAAAGLLGVVIGVVALGFTATPALWRWGFIGLGLASVVTGGVIWWLVEEPPRGASESALAGVITHDNERTFTINVADMFTTLKVPTIWVAIAQGVTGTMPWVVMGFFMINWLVRELGYSNEIDFANPSGSAPLVFAGIVVGTAISNLVGGIIGDRAERYSPNYGRTVIGQFSVFSGVPLTYILFTRGAALSFPQLFGLAFFTAFMIGWPGKGAKEPMMAAVISPELRSSAFSMVNVIEGGLSAFAGLIAGGLADSLGFTRALLWTIPFPWLICGVVFSAFYLTYPKDRDAMQAVLVKRRAQLRPPQKEL
ncbi:MAG: MFS transporter [Anaerolineae bacterium]